MAGDLADRQRLARTDRHRVGHRRDVEHVARLAVVGRHAEPQPAALADGELVACPSCVADRARRPRPRSRPGRAPSRRVRKPAVSPSAMKQMSWLSGLSATARPRRSASARTSALSRVAQREQARPSCPAVSTPSTYDWSLAGSTARCSSDAGPALDQPGVVTGAHRVEPQGERPVQHGRELDLLVAAQAGVRRPAGGVLGDEVVHHVGGEPVGQVPDVERDAEDVGGPAGVVGVLLGAAAAGARCGTTAGSWTAPGGRR